MLEVIMDMVDPLGRRARIRLHVNRMSRRRIAHYTSCARPTFAQEALCTRSCIFTPPGRQRYGDWTRDAALWFLKQAVRGCNDIDATLLTCCTGLHTRSVCFSVHDRAPCVVTAGVSAHPRVPAQCPQKNKAAAA